MIFYTIQTIYFLKAGDTHYSITHRPLTHYPHRPTTPTKPTKNPPKCRFFHFMTFNTLQTKYFMKPHDNPHHTHSLTVLPLACCDLPVTFKPVTPSILSSSGFPPACAAIKIHLIVPFLEENRPLLLLLRLAFPTPAKLRQASTTRSYAPHRVAK